ncbi:MAG: hypothetical protein ACHQFX_19460 [Chitinophagales bacterium]
MRVLSKYLFILFPAQIASLCLPAQMMDDTNGTRIFKPEFRRLINHEAIDKEQNNLLSADGRVDKQFVVTANDEVNMILTNSLIGTVDEFQFKTETDTLLDHRLKVNYLTGIANILKYIRLNWQSKKVDVLHLPVIIEAYDYSIKTDGSGKSIEPIIRALPYDVGTAVLASGIFDKNAGYKSSKDLLILKYCTLNPSETFITLKNNPDVPFVDSLVKVVARKYPAQLYTYAQANNKLGAIIRGIHDDEFVKAVVRMSKSKSGQQYFPFLDNIVKGKMSFEQIDSAEVDSVLYYRLLVKTQLDYTERLLKKDTAIAFKELTAKLEKKAKDVFVTTINGLHDEADAVRFRIIQPLKAEELYYLAVLTDGLIYTSSYTKGVYPLMMKKVNNRGDSLLMLMHFDKYRKFIKMAAGFNMLSNFLSSFPPSANPDSESDAEKLMKAFVGKLEEGTGLEDGVDVADSYASVVETIPPIGKEMLHNIQANYQRNLLTNNKRGIAIYKILHNLFLSADTLNKIDLTRELGIPPVYEVPFTALTNESGGVIVQLFIYGDKDGIGLFPSVLNMFGNANWKIDRSNSQWVTITSVKGKLVTLYLNRPLPEEKNEDAEAQAALCKYLEKNKLYPTVTINRGHSYNAPYTIEQMFPTSKIVFMGSCGGYRLIHDILQKAPDAHIIGTKQIADVPVNNPFLKLLTDKLREGSNIDWIPFWKELDGMVTNEIFEDYVPPYKNLGALFIKAYKRAMGEE